MSKKSDHHPSTTHHPATQRHAKAATAGDAHRRSEVEVASNPQQIMVMALFLFAFVWLAVSAWRGDFSKVIGVLVDNPDIVRANCGDWWHAVWQTIPWLPLMITLVVGGLWLVLWRRQPRSRRPHAD